MSWILTILQTHVSLEDAGGFTAPGRVSYSNSVG
jgi:hypothetical protein